MDTESYKIKEDVRRDRDARGRFVKGVRPKGAGKPKGSVSKLVSIARDALADILPDVIEEARVGDEKARKLLFEYGMPRVKPSLLPVEMPGDPDGIIRAMASGEIAADVAGDAMAVHLTAARIEEITKLQQEVEELKEAVKAMGVR